jgi:hypothetical protein
MYRILGVTLALLALAIGIVPQFTHCAPHPAAMSNSMQAPAAMGSQATSSMGMQSPAAASTPAPMAGMAKIPKCSTTAKAEIGVAIPLFAVGAVLTFSRRKGMIIGFSALGIVLGIMAVALPAGITGTCATPTMICNTAMKPSVYALGSLTVLGSIGSMIAGSKLKT